ncbi:hypothetical protein ABZ897_13295 [Nonomuraea sp. NPDC046802]|uniref:hypothetical protein n=1 Tax=Nonomuraea sp. NPDC046802 TaxID=3154919 RepID=UPI0033BFFCA6
MRRAGLATISLVAGASILGLGGSSGKDPAAQGPAGQPRKITPAEIRILDHAEQVLIAECMRGKGFRYDVVKPTRDDPQADTFRYVIDDISWASRHGLGTRDQARVRNEPTHNERRLSTMPKDIRAAYGAALMGPPPAAQAHVLEMRLPNGEVIGMSGQGCVAQARTELYHDLRGWFRATMIVNNLAPVVATAIEKDQAYRVSVKAWAACMHRAGHPYDGPGELRAEAAERTAGRDPETAHRIEVPLAVAEAKCAQRTGLGNVIQGLERRQWAALALRYRADIESLRRLRLNALHRARHLIAGG